MKNKVLLGIFGVFLIAIAGIVMSVKYNAPEPGALIYVYSVTDTITDTENDTISLPDRLVSKWSGGWFLETTQLSGTQEIRLASHENAKATGTSGWYVQGTTVDLTGSSDVDRLVYDPIHGQRARAIIDGGQDGAATQSTKYTITFIGKRFQ